MGAPKTKSMLSFSQRDTLYLRAVQVVSFRPGPNGAPLWDNVSDLGERHLPRAKVPGILRCTQGDINLWFIEIRHSQLNQQRTR